MSHFPDLRILVCFVCQVWLKDIHTDYISSNILCQISAILTD